MSIDIWATACHCAQVAVYAKDQTLVDTEHDKTRCRAAEVAMKYARIGKKGSTTTTSVQEDIGSSEQTQWMEIPVQTSLLTKGIEVLNLSRRSYNALKRAGIDRVLDLASKTASELDTIKNLGAQSLAEIRFKLRQYLEANSIAPSDFPITDKIGGFSDPATQVETGTRSITGSLEMVEGETHNRILSPSELLDLTLFQAVQYPHMTPEHWGDFVAKCKTRLGIGSSAPGNVSVYGRSAIPLDPKLAAHLGARAFNALERAGVYDLESASKITVRELVAIRQIGRNATTRLFHLLKSTFALFQMNAQ